MTARVGASRRRAVAALLVLTAAGCAAAPAASVPTSPAPTSPAVIAAAGPDVDLASGAVLRPWGPTTVDVTTLDDGSRRVRVVVAGVTDDAVSLLPPAGATWDLLVDESASLLGPDGAWLGGLAAPDGPAGTGLRLDDGALHLVTTGPGTVTLWFATTAVAGTSWGDREGGRSLAVTPTAWARRAGPAADAGVWAQLVAADPGLDTASMHAQLSCHLLGAPDKDTWNLEPWRPEVDAVTMLATRCNPTQADAGS